MLQFETHRCPKPAEGRPTECQCNYSTLLAGGISLPRAAWRRPNRLKSHANNGPNIPPPHQTEPFSTKVRGRANYIQKLALILECCPYWTVPSSHFDLLLLSSLFSMSFPFLILFNCVLSFDKLMLFLKASGLALVVALLNRFEKRARRPFMRPGPPHVIMHA